MHKDQPDHVVRVAMFALEALEFAAQVKVGGGNPDNDNIAIRVGLHTGRVVGGVVGLPTLNPRFCLFGDAMNIASRMQTASLPGRIQCSEITAAALKQSDLRDRVRRRPGRQDIKGKGEMVTFWLMSDTDIKLESRQKRLSKMSNTSAESMSIMIDV